MSRLSRSAWIAIAAAVAFPATIAIAQKHDHGAASSGMSDDTRARLQEGKLAGAKAALKLTAEQEKLWEPVEAQIRAAHKERDDHHAHHQKMREERQKQRAEGKDVAPDMIARLDMMSEHMAERAVRIKAFTEAFKPFYASLSDDQKKVLRPLSRDVMPFMGRGGMGRGGHKMGGMKMGKGGMGGMGGGHGGGCKMGGKSMGAADDAKPADTGDSADDDTPSDDQE